MMNSPTTRHAFEFNGQGRVFFRIWLVNTLLTLCTLGLYRPWASIRIQRYLYQHTCINNHRFDYHETPKARLHSQLLISQYFLIPSLIGAFIPMTQTTLTWLSGTGVLLVLICIPLLIVKSLQFKLNNTSINGIRLHFNGQSHRLYRIIGLSVLALVFSGLALLGFLSLVLHHTTDLNALPIPSFLQTWSSLQKLSFTIVMLMFTVAGFSWLLQQHAYFLINHTQLGNTPFQLHIPKKTVRRTAAQLVAVTTTGVVIYTAMVLCSLMIAQIHPSNHSLLSNLKHLSLQTLAPTHLVLLGIFVIIPFTLIRAYWHHTLHHLIWNHTQLGLNNRFQTTLHVLKATNITLSNVVFTLLTCGLYYPFGKIRLLRYKLQHLSLHTTKDLIFYSLDNSKSIHKPTIPLADSLMKTLHIRLPL